MASTVTNTGLKSFVDAMVADNTVRHLGWGTGSGQTATATDLATAAPEARTAGTMAAATTNTTDDTMRVTGTITATAARAITEVGLFSAATGAVMKAYADFTVINLALNDAIAFTFDVILDQG